MLKILPIRSLDPNEPDCLDNVLNLAKLLRGGVDVCDGVVIFPPEIILQTTLRHLVDSDYEVFEQKLVVLRNEFKKIEPDPQLERTLKSHDLLFFNNSYLRRSEVWNKLLDFWLGKIKERFLGYGFKMGLKQIIHPQVLIFVDKKSVIISSYIDPETKELVVNSESKIDLRVIERIEEEVKKINKALFLPQVVNFILEPRLKVVAVSPHTHIVRPTQAQEVEIPTKAEEKLKKRAIKLFVNNSSGFHLLNEYEGVVIETDKIPNLESILFKLKEAQSYLNQKVIILKLGSTYKQYKGIISQIRKSADLSYIRFCLGEIRSKVFLEEVLKELELSSLPIWLELSVMENILNLGEYLRVGIEGVIINLDKLNLNILGKDEIDELHLTQTTQALMKSLDSLFNESHLKRIPVLAAGSLVLKSEVLEELIKKGVWGVVANTLIESQGLSDHLSSLEKSLAKERLNNNIYSPLG